MKQAFACAASFPVLVRWRTLGYWIRAMRSSLRITQQELSRRSGVPRATISRIETGRVDPQVSTVRRLFEAAGCELAWLPRCRNRAAYIRKTGYRGSGTGA